jgi:sialic acid synthase SpsE
MKIDEKLYNLLNGVDLNNIIISYILTKECKSEDVLFFSSIFTQRASRRLSSVTLLRTRNSPNYGFALKCLTYENLRLV